MCLCKIFPHLLFLTTDKKHTVKASWVPAGEGGCLYCTSAINKDVTESSQSQKVRACLEKAETGEIETEDGGATGRNMVNMNPEARTPRHPRIYEGGKQEEEFTLASSAQLLCGGTDPGGRAARRLLSGAAQQLKLEPCKDKRGPPREDTQFPKTFHIKK